MLGSSEQNTNNTFYIGNSLMLSL